MRASFTGAEVLFSWMKKERTGNWRMSSFQEVMRNLGCRTKRLA